ncbi:MAG: hypothetical protein JO165_05605 [Candidatus Eremiobacteraeota bacterium]|nr:hypothetical protein [Candidatus Eremiobacteraeota bacterium]
MTRRFVSEPLEPLGATADDGALSRGEPALPAAFRWRDRELHVVEVRGRRRGTKDDRGDTYLKRFYYDFRSSDGALVSVYFERHAKRGAARWWLYSLDEPEGR